MTISTGFSAGLADQEQEIIIDSLEVEGELPKWLSGELIRNGPAKWQIGDRRVNHWFDGLAMLHRFGIDDGRVSYANKFLRSRDYLAARQGKIAYDGFATDPCRSLFKRMTSKFHQELSGNTNVNITKVADEFVAMTETPIQVAFDKDTLETLGVVEYSDDLKPGITTAHPHFDAGTGESVNYMLAFGPTSTYTVFGLPAGRKTRRTLGTAKVKKPSYMHSFAMTENYIVLMEFPFVVNPLGMLIGGKPFIANYHWHPELGTTFTVIDRSDGTTRQVHTGEAWFAFHHVNAFEDSGGIHIDVSVYEDAEIVSGLALDCLLGPSSATDYSPPPFPVFKLRRFSLDLDAGSVASRQLSTQPIELPRINYGEHNTRPYRFAYGVSVDPDAPAAFLDRLAKVDVTTGESRVWRQADSYPGEPVFVAEPNGGSEDSGVVLTVILDGSSGSSFLLVLDARDMTELARANVPQTVPFGFHGQFIR